VVVPAGVTQASFQVPTHLSSPIATSIETIVPWSAETTIGRSSQMLDGWGIIGP